MDNNLTKADIKNSIEYQWRKNSLKWVLVLWAIIIVVFFFAMLIGNAKDIAFALQICLIVTSIYSAVLLPFAFFYCYKMMHLLKHYKKFNAYEVLLDKISTSYAYRGAVYYTVTIESEGFTNYIDTNAYFSSGVFAKFPLEDYNNKKVIGLYDSELNKFYIIKKAD